MGFFDRFKKKTVESASEIESNEPITDPVPLSEVPFDVIPDTELAESEEFDHQVSIDAAEEYSEPVVFIEKPNPEYLVPSPASLRCDKPEFGTSLRSVFDAMQKIGSADEIFMPIGIADEVNPVFFDLLRFPHLLVSGTSGSGKSTFLHAVIASMLLRFKPEELRLLLIDTKMLEFSQYRNLPHLLVPIIFDPKKAIGAIQWASVETMKRYRMFAEAKVKNLDGYNLRVHDDSADRLPMVLVIVDEASDLMQALDETDGDALSRVAQMGRAAGVHLIISAQQPKALPKELRSSFMNRMAFVLPAKSDSVAALESPGAEKLAACGEALFKSPSLPKPVKVLACSAFPDEIHGILDEIAWTNSEYGCIGGNYSDEVMSEVEFSSGQSIRPKARIEPDFEDELLFAAIELVLDSGQASVSTLQRRLKLGHTRTGRLMDTMECLGIVGPHEGSKPREILITKNQWEGRKRR